MDADGAGIDLAGLEPPLDQGGYDPGPPSSDDRYDGPRRNGRGGKRDRVPPHSLEAEVSVLGAAMLAQHAASTVTEVLKPEDFYRSAHGVVFEAIQSLVASGTAVDTISVLEWIRDRHRVDEIGGPAAVTDLVAATPTSANAEYYANVVREKVLVASITADGVNLDEAAVRALHTLAGSAGMAEFTVIEALARPTYELASALRGAADRIVTDEAADYFRRAVEALGRAVHALAEGLTTRRRQLPIWRMRTPRR